MKIRKYFYLFWITISIYSCGSQKSVYYHSRFFSENEIARPKYTIEPKINSVVCCIGEEELWSSGSILTPNYKIRHLPKFDRNKIALDSLNFEMVPIYENMYEQASLECAKVIRKADLKKYVANNCFIYICDRSFRIHIFIIKNKDYNLLVLYHNNKGVIFKRICEKNNHCFYNSIQDQSLKKILSSNNFREEEKINSSIEELFLLVNNEKVEYKYEYYNIGSSGQGDEIVILFNKDFDRIISMYSWIEKSSVYYYKKEYGKDIYSCSKLSFIYTILLGEMLYNGL